MSQGGFLKSGQGGCSPNPQISEAGGMMGGVHFGVFHRHSLSLRSRLEHCVIQAELLKNAAKPPAPFLLKNAERLCCFLTHPGQPFRLA